MSVYAHKHCMCMYTCIYISPLWSFSTLILTMETEQAPKTLVFQLSFDAADRSKKLQVLRNTDYFCCRMHHRKRHEQHPITCTDFYKVISKAKLHTHMWDPQCLTTLWASMACYRDSFTFLYVHLPNGTSPSHH
jgi:hypothetical protein